MVLDKNNTTTVDSRLANSTKTTPMSKNPEKDFVEYMKAHNLEGLFETLTASLLKNKPKV